MMRTSQPGTGSPTEPMRRRPGRVLLMIAEDSVRPYPSRTSQLGILRSSSWITSAASGAAPDAKNRSDDRS
jgi:hypothetical protein